MPERKQRSNYLEYGSTCKNSKSCLLLDFSAVQSDNTGEDPSSNSSLGPLYPNTLDPYGHPFPRDRMIISGMDQAHRDQLYEARRCLEVHRYCPRHLLSTGLTAASNGHSTEKDQVAGLQASHNNGDHENQHAPLLAIAQLATFRLDADDCTISLIDNKYQYILARTARCLPLQQTSSDQSDGSSLSKDLVISRDASIDSLVLDRALRTNAEGITASSLIITNFDNYGLPSIVSRNEDERVWTSYAGTALLSANKTVIGVFSIKSFRSSDEKHSTQIIAILEDLAKIVSNLLQAQLAYEERLRAETMITGLSTFTAEDQPLQLTAASPRSDVDKESERLQVSTRQFLPEEDASYTSKSSHQDTWSDTSEEARQSISRKSSVGQSEIAETKSTGHEFVSTSDTPQNGTRENNVGNGAPTASHSTDFQKSLLPPQTQSMFSRAARIIRKAGDLDGVIFVDAAVISLGQNADLVSDQNGRPGQSTVDSSSQQSCNSSDSRLEGDSSSSETSSAFRTTSGSGPRTCLVLGSSHQSHSDRYFLKQVEDSFRLPEKMLQRVLKTHPDGRVIHFSTEGILTTSSSDETSDNAASKILLHNGQVKQSKANSVSRCLKMLLPRARSLCLLPIWNYERDRWFACCIAWSEDPRRILSPRTELVYLKTFGSAIMAELGRLSSLSVHRKKTTFISSISHELRSPLHGILGSVGFLQNTELDAFQAAMLLSIRTCGNTLIDVIDHVLDVTQMEALQGQGRSTLHYRDDKTVHLVSNRRSTVDPALSKLSTVLNLTTATEEVVESMYASLSFQVQGNTIDEHHSLQAVPLEPNGEFASSLGGNRKPVLIILELPRELETAVDIPVGAWRRILMNLVGNAIKYTTSGHIRITVKLGSSTKSLDRKFSRITLSVCDTGIGMSREFLVNRAFKAFTQEDSFSSGVGLGLHLVRQIVTSLHGSMKIQSEPNKGTNIRVSLDVPKAGMRPCVVEREDDDHLKQARGEMKSKSVCILHNYRTDSKDPVGSTSQGMKLFGDAIQQTLQEWLDIEPVVTSKLDKHNVDIVIMLESSFEQLQDILSVYRARPEPPIVLMLAKDAVEAGTLKTDVRVSSGSSIVEVVSQPCGPIKLANVLIHCLHRKSMLHDKQASLWKSRTISRTITTTTPTASLSSSSSFSSSTSSISGSPYSDVPGSLREDAAGKVVKIGQASAEAQTTGSTKVVLIVDDNPINRKLLATMFQKNQMDYIEAENGFQALQLYQRMHQNITIVLMDISMPVMDGMTATQHIRKFERAENIPRITILALTGLVSVSARLEALESGVDDVLTKPVKFAHLLVQIRSLTAAAEAQEATINPDT